METLARPPLPVAGLPRTGVEFSSPHLDPQKLPPGLSPDATERDTLLLENCRLTQLLDECKLMLEYEQCLRSESERRVDVLLRQRDHLMQVLARERAKNAAMRVESKGSTPAGSVHSIANGGSSARSALASARSGRVTIGSPTSAQSVASSRAERKLMGTLKRANSSTSSAAAHPPRGPRAGSSLKPNGRAARVATPHVAAEQEVSTDTDAEQVAMQHTLAAQAFLTDMELADASETAEQLLSRGQLEEGTLAVEIEAVEPAASAALQAMPLTSNGLARRHVDALNGSETADPDAGVARAAPVRSCISKSSSRGRVQAAAGAGTAAGSATSQAEAQQEEGSNHSRERSSKCTSAHVHFDGSAQPHSFSVPPPATPHPCKGVLAPASTLDSAGNAHVHFSRATGSPPSRSGASSAAHSNKALRQSRDAAAPAYDAPSSHPTPAEPSSAKRTNRMVLFDTAALSSFAIHSPPASALAGASRVAPPEAAGADDDAASSEVGGSPRGRRADDSAIARFDSGVQCRLSRVATSDSGTARGTSQDPLTNSLSAASDAARSAATATEAEQSSKGVSFDLSRERAEDERCVYADSAYHVMRSVDRSPGCTPVVGGTPGGKVRMHSGPGHDNFAPMKSSCASPGGTPHTRGLGRHSSVRMASTACAGHTNFNPMRSSLASPGCTPLPSQQGSMSAEMLNETLATSPEIPAGRPLHRPGAAAAVHVTLLSAPGHDNFHPVHDPHGSPGHTPMQFTTVPTALHPARAPAGGALQSHPLAGGVRVDGEDDVAGPEGGGGQQDAPHVVLVTEAGHDFFHPLHQRSGSKGHTPCRAFSPLSQVFEPGMAAAADDEVDDCEPSCDGHAVAASISEAAVRALSQSMEVQERLTASCQGEARDVWLPGAPAVQWRSLGGSSGAECVGDHTGNSVSTVVYHASDSEMEFSDAAARGASHPTADPVRPLAANRRPRSYSCLTSTSAASQASGGARLEHAPGAVPHSHSTSMLYGRRHAAGRPQAPPAPEPLPGGLAPTTHGDTGHATSREAAEQAMESCLKNGPTPPRAGGSRSAELCCGDNGGYRGRAGIRVVATGDGDEGGYRAATGIRSLGASPAGSPSTRMYTSAGSVASEPLPDARDASPRRQRTVVGDLKKVHAQGTIASPENMYSSGSPTKSRTYKLK